MYFISCNFSFYLYQVYPCTFAKVTLAKAFLYFKILLRVWGIKSWLCCLPALQMNYICILDIPSFKVLRHYHHRYFSMIIFFSGALIFYSLDRQLPVFLNWVTTSQILIFSYFLHVLFEDSWKRGL